MRFTNIRLSLVTINFSLFNYPIRIMNIFIMSIFYNIRNFFYRRKFSC